jgi:hypothetical protein
MTAMALLRSTRSTPVWASLKQTILNLKMDFYPHLGNHKAKLDKDAELKRKEPGNNAATAGSGPVS